MEELLDQAAFSLARHQGGLAQLAGLDSVV